MEKEIATINYELNSLEERIKHIGEKLDEEKQLYYSYQFEKSYSKLVVDSSELMRLEKYSNYLLKLAPKDSVYRYEVMNQKEFDYKLEQEGKLYIESEEFLANVRVDKNDYINMSVTISEKDLIAEDELGKILRDYQRGKEHLLKEMRKMQNGETSKYKLYEIKKHLQSINDDIIQAKIHYKGIVDKHDQVKWFGDIVDYDLIIDYKNPNHIKAILKYLRLDCDIDPSKSLSLVAEDLSVAIRMLKEDNIIDDIDNKIITGINVDNCTLRELEGIIGMRFSSIHKRFNRICNKISAFLSK